ncbi:MAG: dihydrolipoyllysine-residue succinyltransferase [Marinilabiliales bacterium]|nr:MAG: dihydrolipoyllysine-residue succinyltransferase [Marinilabiliales bacterium]
MILEIKAPSPGESITEVEIASWLVQDGDYVHKDQEVGEIESEKATLAIIADKAGNISLKAEPGSSVKVGDVVCTIDTNAEAPANTENKDSESEVKDKKVESKAEPITNAKSENKNVEKLNLPEKMKITPVAQNMMKENNLSVDDVLNGLKRIGKEEVEMILDGNMNFSATTASSERTEDRSKMTSLRKKLSERLVSVKNETAMLTTFNEVDMSAVIELRKKYQKTFVEKHGIKLGFMSFFTKAVSIALQHFPLVNSRIEEDEIVTPSYKDIGIAVQTEKGLMVPVLRNTEKLGLADIENQIMDLATRARKSRLTLDEMTGGTFTITNGGVFGSLLSTPLINPPQAGILGMHNITERPVAINGKVEVRPVMFVALSYDHRIIDGRDSVGFLKMVKELIEEPVKILSQGKNPDELLLEV